MAFVRKKGKSFYLVHNVREDGRVRQVHLACLGNRPRVNEEVEAQVKQAHPHLQIDWNAVRGRAADTFTSPFTNLEGARQLTRALRGLHLDLEELNLATLRQRLQAGTPRRDSGAESSPGSHPSPSLEASPAAEATPAPDADTVMRELMGEMEQLRSSLDTKLKHQPANQLASPSATHSGGHEPGGRDLEQSGD